MKNLESSKVAAELSGNDLAATEELSHDREIWRAAIDVQIHFNELLVKMRTTVISVVLAVFGAVAIALRESKLMVLFLGWKIHIGIMISVFGIGFLLAQFFLDYCYYFKLLLGAVNFTKKMDEKYSGKIRFGLTTEIMNSISVKGSKFWLFLFYWVPIALGAFAIFGVLHIYPLELVK